MKQMRTVPKYVFRIGLINIVFTIISILGVGWFYSYPDIIESEIVLTSTPPPINVLSKSSGYIDSIFVNEGEYIKEGQTLAVIQDNTNYHQLMKIDKFVDSCLNISNPFDYLHLNLPIFTNTGELGDVYLSLYNEFSLLVTELKNSNVISQINSINNEKELVESLNKIILDEMMLYNQENDLVQFNYKRENELYNNGIISQRQFELEKIKIIQQEEKNKQIKRRYLDNKKLINNLDKSSNQLINDRELLINKKLVDLNGAMIKYKLKFNDWIEKYMIKAPYEGFITYSLFDNEDLYVHKDDIVFTIIPSDTISNIHADCFVPARAFGKIDKGSRISIRLSAYPYQEYGSIDSYIEKISSIPILKERNNQPLYLARVHLSNPIITNYQDTIPFKNELRGIGRIITKERNIFDRLFDKIISPLKNG